MYKRIIINLLNFFGIAIAKVDEGRSFLISNKSTIQKYKLHFKNLLSKSYNLTNDEVIKVLVTKDNPIVFDVGANVGTSIDRFNKIFSSAEFYCFEPGNNEFQILNKNYNYANIKLFNFALGSKNESQKFYINPISLLSSFNAINDNSKVLKTMQKELFVDLSQTIKTTEVQVKTLDSFLEDQDLKSIDILKIDVQNYEDKVLLGAKKSLLTNKFKVIELELNVGTTYKKNLNFYEIDKILIENNYRLVAIDNFGNLISNPDLQFNLIYADKENIKKILNL
jgi:FkbM family methyltransferase